MVRREPVLPGDLCVIVNAGPIDAHRLGQVVQALAWDAESDARYPDFAPFLRIDLPPDPGARYCAAPQAWLLKISPPDDTREATDARVAEVTA